MGRKNATRDSEQQQQNILVDCKIDHKKTLGENFDNGMKYWDTKAEEARLLEDQISQWTYQLQNIPDIPSRRAERADLRIKIEEESKRVKKLKDERDRLDFLVCVSKVIDQNNVKPKEVKQDTNEEVFNEVKIIPSNGPMRPRDKKKPSNQKANTVQTCSSDLFIEEVDECGDNSVEQCKQLAQLRHELPSEDDDLNICPRCPIRVNLEFVESPPSLVCYLCGLSKKSLDNTSPAVHDKDTPYPCTFSLQSKTTL